MKLLAFPLIWLIGTVAAFLYAQDRDIPTHIVVAVLPAFLLEASFYYVLGVESLRRKLDQLPKAAVAALLAIAAITPYSIATLALGNFHWHSVGILGGFALLAAFWYVLLPNTPLFDILFLILVASVWLSRILPAQFPEPAPRVQLAALGQLMWFRTGLFAMLSVRRMPNVGFGFWPSGREWRVGALFFVIFLPVAAGLGWAIGFTYPHMRYSGVGRITLLALATFFGTLWVLALGEEFLFRGLLQQWLVKWLRKEWAGLVAASLLFGSVHLWYRQFPNWRFAALATLAGIFYGLAFRQTKSIRASMVTHALTVTTWRMFFS
jgi:membrane protease YdiL (CAAX protease family)